MLAVAAAAAEATNAEVVAAKETAGKPGPALEQLPPPEEAKRLASCAFASATEAEALADAPLPTAACAIQPYPFGILLGT